ncbi:hypothetical protein [Bacillus sinesaloumensis]|uniref:hypothetical protein n=1 Tax=Litchfieldia sinesaloumensis TaxID=1926280 RepID=UPI00098864AB|nr:hypothetical protein [Bacillus sinesaloumensis]
MIKKFLVCFFLLQLFSSNAFAEHNQQIQIFDINQDKVIKQIENNADIQQEVSKYLKNVDGVYTKYNPIPNSGFMVRIPVEPPTMVRSRWFDDLVDEITIIFPTQEAPYLMLFDDENQTYFLTFKGNTDPLLKLLNFNPKTPQ